MDKWEQALFVLALCDYSKMSAALNDTESFRYQMESRSIEKRRLNRRVETGGVTKAEELLLEQKTEHCIGEYLSLWYRIIEGYKANEPIPHYLQSLLGVEPAELYRFRRILVTTLLPFKDRDDFTEILLLVDVREAARMILNDKKVNSFFVEQRYKGSWLSELVRQKEESLAALPDGMSGFESQKDSLEQEQENQNESEADSDLKDPELKTKLDDEESVHSDCSSVDESWCVVELDE